MSFACIYIPGFMVQSAVRAEPALQGGALALHGRALALPSRALALISGKPPLWSVVAANAAAVQAGVQLGMTKAQVAEFCAVEIRHRSEVQEKAAHAALLDVGWSISPRVEDTAADTIVLDITGLTSLFGSVKNLAAALAERAASIGLRPHVAVASNIEAAIHAARGFHGITLIPPSEESERLSSLPVEVLFPSVETFETLCRWGIRTCGELAALPLLPLSERMGQEGVRLHELARGTHCRAPALA